jgi:hypothetical protein
VLRVALKTSFVGSGAGILAWLPKPSFSREMEA